jgi:hypothetical protein
MNTHLPLPDEPEGWRQLQQEALAERAFHKLYDLLKHMNELLAEHEHEPREKQESCRIVADLKQRTRDVARSTYILLTVALALSSIRATAQAQQGRRLDFVAPFAGTTLSCPQSERLLISRPFAERAKIKARLLDLLRQSLYDDAKGVVNISRDKEIRSLTSKLRAGWLR